MVNAWWISAVAGLVCGVLSGLGIGGGSLLMVWMTAVIGIEQRLAQGINLLYFIPTAIGAFIFHKNGKTIYWKAVVPAAIAGCIFSALSAWFAGQLDVELLRKLFGGFLVIVGISELRQKKRPEPS